MLKSQFVLAAMLAASVVIAEPGPPPLPPVGQPNALRAKLAERAGGYVYKIAPGKALKVVYDKGAVDLTVVNRAIASIREYVLIEAFPAEGAFPLDYAKDEKFGAWVFVEDNGDNPALLVAPEEAWARVNVRKLKVDGADTEKVNARIVKEIWRGAAIAMGASDGQMQPSLMRSIKNLKMLDVAPQIPSPDTFNKMLAFAKDRDFAEVKRATYRRACKEGWAPAPTNDLQKSIWDQVRSIPTKPLKLKKQ